MPAAIPLIATGVSTAYAAYSAHKQRKQADKDRAAQQPLIDAQTGLAQQAASQGAQAFSFGMPLLQRSGDYYSRLLSGDRSMLRAATTPERTEISDLYRGAERNLDRSGIQGASRDMARAELGRERVGKLASLLPNMRANAASQAGNLGQIGISQGQSGTLGAGGLYSNLMAGQLGRDRLAMEQRSYNDEQNAAMGKLIGQLITQSYDAYKNRGTGRT